MIHSQAVAQTPLMYEQEWAGLLARIAAGDQPALAEFYDASSAKVFGLVMKILADRTVARHHPELPRRRVPHAPTCLPCGVDRS